MILLDDIISIQSNTHEVDFRHYRCFHILMKPFLYHVRFPSNCQRFISKKKKNMSGTRMFHDNLKTRFPSFFSPCLEMTLDPSVSHRMKKVTSQSPKVNISGRLSERRGGAGGKQEGGGGQEGGCLCHLFPHCSIIQSFRLSRHMHPYDSGSRRERGGASTVGTTFRSPARLCLLAHGSCELGCRNEGWEGGKIISPTPPPKGEEECFHTLACVCVCMSLRR